VLSLKKLEQKLKTNSMFTISIPGCSGFFKHFTDSSATCLRRVRALLERRSITMRENRMDENVTIVYTAYITLRNGHRLYAKQYGKKAFELHIRDNKHHKRK